MTAPLFVANNHEDDPERFWGYGNGLSWHMQTEKGLQFNQKRGGTNGFSTVMIFNSRYRARRGCLHQYRVQPSRDRPQAAR